MLLTRETGEVTEEGSARRTACVAGAFNLQPEHHLGEVLRTGGSPKMPQSSGKDSPAAMAASAST